MRHGEPDKGDRPGGGSCGAGKDHRSKADHGATALHLEAETTRNVIAQRQPVEDARGEQRQHDTGEDEGGDLQQDIGGSAGERADLPETDLVEGFDIGDEDG